MVRGKLFSHAVLTKTLYIKFFVSRIMPRTRPSILASCHSSIYIYAFFITYVSFSTGGTEWLYTVKNVSYPVVNMASYATSSSLILVIHDNMINGTNHIV
jgi:hypothetical protein